MDIENLLAWSSPKQVETKKGPAILRKASPTKAFWDTWKTSKDALKTAGISCSKTDEGYWEICWWKDATEVREYRAESVEASHKTTADIYIPCPDGLRYMPFQLAGITYALEHPKCLIADEMGLGKTIQAIGVINQLHAHKALIICPASLKINWKREMEKWLVDQRTIEIENGTWKDADICIVNYDILKKHIEDVTFDDEV